MSVTARILVSKGGDTGYVAPKATVFFHIYLSDALLAKVDAFTGVAIQAGRLRHDIVFSRGVGLGEHALAYIRRALDRRLIASSLEIEGRMLLLLDTTAALLGDRGPRAPVRGGLTAVQMRRISDYVHEHVDEDMHLEDLAAIAGLGPTPFGQAFRQTTRSSPCRWVLQARIAPTQVLLASPDLPLAEVAHCCGFADQSHFTNTLRRGSVGLNRLMQYPHDIHENGFVSCARNEHYDRAIRNQRTVIMQIKDSVALVTGANRGVGFHYVQALLSRGARKVYAAARDKDSLAAAVALDPQRVVALKLDVTDAADIAAAAASAADVTLLINNAGVLSFGGALDVAQEAIDRDMAVNFGGLLQVTRAFAPAMEANGGGAVANMLTLLSFVSAPGFSAYNASKAAAWSMAMSLRPYLAQKGIAVLNAFPAGIDTDMLAGVDAAKDRPEAVVKDVLDGVEAGAQDVYPASAAGVYTAWRQDQKAVEGMFAGMM